MIRSAAFVKRDGEYFLQCICDIEKDVVGGCVIYKRLTKNELLQHASQLIQLALEEP